jgi:hypothetical protein
MKKTFCAVIKLLASLSILLLLELPSIAATVQFKGYVTHKGSLTTGPINTIAVGDTISGSFSYDPNIPDTNSWSVWGEYKYNNSNSSLSLIVYDLSAGGSELFNLAGFLNEINVTNNWSYPGYPTIDGFNPEGEFSLPTEIIDLYIHFQNRNTGLDIFNTDELPNPLPPYNQFNYTTASLNSRKSWSYVDIIITWSKTVLDPVRIEGESPSYYSTLQDAYDSALDGDIIQCKDFVFTEDLYIDDTGNKSVTIQGGYNSDYSSIIGISSLEGDLIISNGTVTIENLLLQ